MFPYLHDPLGLRIWERPQHHAVDDAEDSGVGADPERQCENRHGGETGRLAQRAQGKTPLLKLEW